MSIEKVRAFLEPFGLAGRIMEFPVSSATVAMAARALNCEEREIAKSLTFCVNEQPILIVVAGDARIDNARYKATFGVKAKMLSPQLVSEQIGHEIGGVCPFALKEGVRVYLDESLRRMTRVYPACGSSNSAIALDLQQLERLSGSCGWVDVCKDWKET